MKQVTLPVPEMMGISATRGLLGAGIGMLVANRIRPRNRMKIGWPLLAVGLLSTIPFAIDLYKNRMSDDGNCGT